MEEEMISNVWQYCKPEQVVLVVSKDKDSKANLMPAGWSMRTSGSPPMYCVSIAPARYTHSCIEHSKEFVIAFVGKDMIDVIDLAGSTSGRDTDKFKEANIKTADAKEVSIPLLADAVVNIECKLVDQLTTGDHTIFIGEIKAAHVNKNKKPVLNFGAKEGSEHREYKEC
ncbi:flavin reductase family protein [Candidatus Woesearchaeota archaeon]|nr:flavin reductase family protein [Candidatus Woesearchaeota archaeon]